MRAGRIRQQARRTGICCQIGDDRPNLLRVTDNHFRRMLYIKSETQATSGGFVAVDHGRFVDNFVQVEWFVEGSLSATLETGEILSRELV